MFERQFNKCSPVATTSSPSTCALLRDPLGDPLGAVTVQTLQLCGELQVTAQPLVYSGKYKFSSSEGSKYRFSSSEGSPAPVKAVCEAFPVPSQAVRGDVPVQRLGVVEICEELPIRSQAVCGELRLVEVCKEFPVHSQVVRREVLSVGAGLELVESSFFSKRE